MFPWEDLTVGGLWVGSPRTTWGQPPSAVRSSEARLPFAGIKLEGKTWRSVAPPRQPGVAVPPWFVPPTPRTQTLFSGERLTFSSLYALHERGRSRLHWAAG